jgi:hypothetical protein
MIISDSLRNELMFPGFEEQIGTWEDKNLCSYEMAISKKTKNEVLSIMQSDLNKYFDIKARIEKRKIRCYVLLLCGSPDKLKPKNSNAEPMFKMNVTTGITIVNKPLKHTLYYALVTSNLEQALPIIDQTNYTEAVDLSFNCNLKNIECLKDELRKFNLELVEKEMYVEMLVIEANGCKGIQSGD